MKFQLVNIGKTIDNFINQGVDKYTKRIQHYAPFEIYDLEMPKKTGKILKIENNKKIEGEQIIKFCRDIDFIILLDERGDLFDSEQFARFIQQKMNMGIKNLGFISGGAYGFSDEVYKIADKKISLSKMTFSHQLIRLIFAEQLYRALTIIKGESYHHR